jgi:hypothetical protein
MAPRPLLFMSFRCAFAIKGSYRRRRNRGRWQEEVELKRPQKAAAFCQSSDPVVCFAFEVVGARSFSASTSATMS